MKIDEEPNIQQAKASRMMAAKGRSRRTNLIKEVPEQGGVGGEGDGVGVR